MFENMKMLKKYSKLIKSGKIKSEKDLFKILQEDEGVDLETIQKAKEKAKGRQ